MVTSLYQVCNFVCNPSSADGYDQCWKDELQHVPLTLNGCRPMRLEWRGSWEGAEVAYPRAQVVGWDCSKVKGFALEIPPPFLNFNTACRTAA